MIVWDGCSFPHVQQGVESGRGVSAGSEEQVAVERGAVGAVHWTCVRLKGKCHWRPHVINICIHDRRERGGGGGGGQTIVNMREGELCGTLMCI